ncbi:MAG: hypothetical protein NXI29_27770 [bacterium]|nr:hypothetical protein [bacterium]
MKVRALSFQLQWICYRGNLALIVCFILAFAMLPGVSDSAEKPHTIESAQKKLPELAKRFLHALQNRNPAEFQKQWTSFELFREIILPQLGAGQTPTVAELRKFQADLKDRDQKLKQIHANLSERFGEHQIDLKTLRVFEVSGDIKQSAPDIWVSTNIRMSFKTESGTVLEFNKLRGGMLKGQWTLTELPVNFEYLRNGKRNTVSIIKSVDSLPVYNPPVVNRPKKNEDRFAIKYLKYPAVNSQLILIFQAEDTETKGVSVTILPKGNIQYRDITDAVFNSVFESNIPHVKKILCHHTGISDLTLKKINQHFSGTLEDLDVQLTDITDAGILFLKDCHQLKHLNLDKTKITDRCGSQISQFLQLEKLFLRETRITSEMLRSLQSLKKLRQLFLDDTEISDAGVKHLKALDSLVYLDLDNTRIGNESLSYLKDMKQLKILNLEYTQISDESLKHLQSMTFLSTLNVRDTNLTRAGVVQLMKALPTTQIYSDY